VAEPPDADVPDVTVAAPAAAASDRRARFREAVSGLSTRSTSNDLVRWMLVPGSIAVLLGFSVMLLGWVGAARTAREIEQIPYLISGGLIGLALVVLGGLLLVSTFWVAVLRKLDDERARADSTELEGLRARIRELEAAAVSANGTRRRSTAKPKARVKA
jgi:hypothetical protein